MEVSLIDHTRTDFYEPLIITAHSTRINERKLVWDKEKSIDDMCKDLISWNHTGVFEHIKFTFHISGISRSLTHQLVRHRIASYLQMSNRHAKPNKNDYITPPSCEIKDINDLDSVGCYYHNIINECYNCYESLIKKGVPKEDARYILPPAFFTHITVTMNGRSLRHFLKLRLDEHAQWEIRKVAEACRDIAKEIWPEAMSHFKK